MMAKDTPILHHAKPVIIIAWYVTKKENLYIWHAILFIYLIWKKKLTGTISTGKSATILACTPNCTPGTFNGVTYTCCQTDNCNEDTSLASSNTAIATCNVGGTFSLIDSASNIYAPAQCPATSNSYCLVCFIFFLCNLHY